MTKYIKHVGEEHAKDSRHSSKIRDQKDERKDERKTKQEEHNRLQ